ncbi:putative RNA polymerase II elongation factor Ell [Penaeus vannamei]|uniref:Putative RNA polymerase II elongation factor Ell n=1 Tax=Penaeus vannamei TaxID=6689 RepID=A0A423T6C4_PENVA|nr:putative RNA polymerase II elongation factor Ell [Penaeus vannamei]
MRQLLLAADAPGAAIRTYLGSLSVLIIDVIIFIFARAVSWRQLLCCWLLAAPSPVFPRRSLGALSAPSLRPQSRDSSLGPESGPLSPCLPLGAEIQIPSRHGGLSKFAFILQSIQEDGPQGSFEFIKQIGSRPLESLGPMVGKIFIQAKDDSYEKTRQSMEKAKRKNAMNCVKELKSSSSFGGRLRPAIGTSKKSTTLVVPPPKKERHSRQAAPPPPPTNLNGRKTNPELVGRPLK